MEKEMPKPRTGAGAPSVRVTANLEGIIGSTSVDLVQGYMRITLCGYGPIPPCVNGFAMLANAGVPQYVGPQTSGSTPIFADLWGNDTITPPGTFYEIAICDQNKNVIQSGNYVLNGTATYDLSTLTPLTPPYGYQPSVLRYVLCSGTAPTNTYTAPGIPLIVTYNGVILVPNAPPSSPPLGYNLTGNQINLNFTTQIGDRIYALCVE